MRGGDVIVAFEGAAVGTVAALARAVDCGDVGDEVTVTVVRGGETIDLTAPTHS